VKAVFFSEYFWPEVGGLERSTERLGRELVRRGWHVVMVTQQLPGTAPVEWRGGIEVRRYENGTSVPEAGATFGDRAAAAGVFRDAAFVCVFGVGHDPAGAHLCPVLALDGVPKLIKIGTHGDMSGKGIDPALFRAFDGVLCQNPAIRDEAIGLGVAPEKTFPIRNGLDLAGWRAEMPSRDEARRALVLPAEAFVVAGIGRFVQRKRFPLLVESFAAATAGAAGSSAQSVLLLQGSGFDQHDSEEPRLRALADALPAAFRFIEAGANPAATLAACDVFVTLGEREGAPNVILEALATGRAVVVSDIPGHRVYVDDGVQGLLVTPAVEHVGGAIARLHADVAGRERMGRAAWASADRFDICRTAEDYLSAVDAVKRSIAAR
jgi:glycosyltransferase involved in cell wall biosynthesis